jgi:hypothetical protein
VQLSENPIAALSIGRYEIDFKVFRRHDLEVGRKPFQGLRKFRSTVMQRFMAMKILLKKVRCETLFST